MFSTSQNKSIQSHNKLLNQDEKCITTNVPPIATNNLELTGQETDGTYVNWSFNDNEELYFIPYSELKIIITKLDNLDVTEKTQKAEGMALINQLISTPESITVSKNRRFPLNGHYYDIGCRSVSKFRHNSIQMLYEYLENIDDCIGLNYNQSKSIISSVFMQIVKDKGWIEAFEYACNHFAFPIKSSQSRLEKYLKFLCCFVNMDKDCSICGFDVYNVATFETECGLIWKDVEQ